jgi:hypothetical protein
MPSCGGAQPVPNRAEISLSNFIGLSDAGKIFFALLVKAAPVSAETGKSLDQVVGK